MSTEILLARAIERLARLIRSDEYNSGLNPAQWEALRYLDRANRFSNSPKALAEYLGATKGTVSQTLIALERKHLIRKTKNPHARRFTTLALTPKGKEHLGRDPWLKLQSDAALLNSSLENRLACGLSELLDAALRRRGQPTFGQCRTCRYFGHKQNASAHAGPHRCMLLNMPLLEEDSLRICIEHEPA